MYIYTPKIENVAKQPVKGITLIYKYILQLIQI